MSMTMNGMAAADDFALRVSPPPDEADHARFSPIPSEKDFAWVGVVRQMFQDARAHRRPRVHQWMKNYRVVNTRTWAASRPSYLPDPEVPEIRPILASCVGWMTDQRIRPTVTALTVPNSPYSAQMGELGDMLEAVLNSCFLNGNWEAQIENVLWDAYMYGVGWMKTAWDPLSDGGLGNPSLRRIDPFTLYPDPKATCMEDMSYICEVRTMSISEVARRFGDKVAMKMGLQGVTEESDHAPSSVRPAASPEPMALPGTITVGVPAYGLPGQGRSIGEQHDPGVTIIECWIRETREVEIRGESYRYLTWRCVIISGNNVLFNELAEDMWLHGDHPYSHFTLMETGDLFDYSMAELLTGCQLSINRLLAAIEHNIWLIGNPVFKESTRSGIQRTKITNQPGQRITYNDGEGPEWLNPPQMHPQMATDLIKFYVDEMERISGLTAMNRGTIPAGRNSTEVLDSVQEASFVRIRMALRNLERTLRRCFGQAASLIVEFYDSPRIVAIAGKDGEAASYALRAKHFWLPSDENRTLPMRFTLDVSAGASQPTSRQSTAQEADFLFAMGALDVPAVLEAHQWPGRKKIAERVMAAQQQAAATGAPPPGPAARQRAGRTQ